jgi:hypothetical protein
MENSYGNNVFSVFYISPHYANNRFSGKVLGNFFLQSLILDKK